MYKSFFVVGAWCGEDRYNRRWTARTGRRVVTRASYSGSPFRSLCCGRVSPKAVAAGVSFCSRRKLARARDFFPRRRRPRSVFVFALTARADFRNSEQTPAATTGPHRFSRKFRARPSSRSSREPRRLVLAVWKSPALDAMTIGDSRATLSAVLLVCTMGYAVGVQTDAQAMVSVIINKIIIRVCNYISNNNVCYYVRRCSPFFVDYRIHYIIVTVSSFHVHIL